MKEIKPFHLDVAGQENIGESTFFVRLAQEKDDYFIIMERDWVTMRIGVINPDGITLLKNAHGFGFPIDLDGYIRINKTKSIDSM